MFRSQSLVNVRHLDFNCSSSSLLLFNELSKSDESLFPFSFSLLVSLDIEEALTFLLVPAVSGFIFCCFSLADLVDADGEEYKSVITRDDDEEEDAAITYILSKLNRIHPDSNL